TELCPARLALLVERVDRRDLHVEDLLDRELDLRLVRTGVHLEGVLALVDEVVALLRDNRRENHVTRVFVGGAHALTSSVFLECAAMKPSMAAFVKTMSSLT